MRVLRNSSSNGNVSYLDSLENLIRALYKSVNIDYVPKIKEYDDLLNDLSEAITFVHNQGGHESSLVPKVGAITTLNPEEEATLEITPNYSEGTVTYSFGIPRGYKGEDGKSAFDIWKEVVGRPDATKEDFIDDISYNIEWGTF